MANGGIEEGNTFLNRRSEKVAGTVVTSAKACRSDAREQGRQPQSLCFGEREASSAARRAMAQPDLSGSNNGRRY